MHLRIGTMALLFVFACVSLAADNIHKLLKGETLYSLARRYNVSTDAIMARNNITNPSALAVGMKLIIPKEGSLATTANAANELMRYHQVSKGDTYYGIALRYGLKVDDLLQLNKRTAKHVLSIGEKLNVGRSTGGQAVSIPDKLQAQYNAGASSRVDAVPWWPVAGIKSSLDGKLQGVSIKAEPLSYVHAVAAGQVVWTGAYRGFKNVVLVDSNGYIFLYGGNEDIFVNVGETVKAGSRIGRLASSGPGGEPGEMYFSVFRDGVPIAPEQAPRG